MSRSGFAGGFGLETRSAAANGGEMPGCSRANANRSPVATPQRFKAISLHRVVRHWCQDPELCTQESAPSVDFDPIVQKVRAGSFLGSA